MANAASTVSSNGSETGTTVYGELCDDTCVKALLTTLSTSEAARVPLPADVYHEFEFPVKICGTRGLRLRDCTDPRSGAPYGSMNPAIRNVDHARLNVHETWGMFTPQQKVAVRRSLVSRLDAV